MGIAISIGGLAVGSSGSSWTPQSWYGIEINEANSSPDVTRIAGIDNMGLHALLPVHVNIKACLLQDNGVVNYYLDPLDWTKKIGGAASDLTGTDGQVMIEVPRFYRKVDNPSGGVYQKKISPYPIAGFELIPKFYIAAYEAALSRSTLKLASVKNLSVDYRGGNNTSAWDAADNTLLGKPATSISLTNSRLYAHNRGSQNWNVLPWRQSMLLYELFMIEYATLNSQKAVNAALTVDGYKQGGLGNGVSTADATEWNNFCGFNPYILCGASDSLGNASGEVSVVKANFGGAGVNRTFKVPKYRGVENLFGHVWEWKDGGSVLHGAAGGVSKFYTCDSPDNFADETVVNYDYRSDLPAVSGMIKKVTHDSKGIMIPLESGGSSLTYFSDYFYTPGLVNTWAALRYGGAADSGDGSGLGCLFVSNAASAAAVNFGARLCYIPNQYEDYLLLPIGICKGTVLGNILYAINVLTKKAVKSVDFGDTWTDFTKIFDTAPSSIFASKDGILFVEEGVSVWRSDDDGVTWNTVLTTSGGIVQSWGWAQAPGGNIFMGEYSNAVKCIYVWRSTDNGLNWTRLDGLYTFSDKHIHQVFVDYETSRLYVTIGDALKKCYYSDDNGDNWTQIFSTNSLAGFTGSSSNADGRYFAEDGYPISKIYKSLDDANLITIYNPPSEFKGSWAEIVAVDGSTKLFGLYMNEQQEVGSSSAIIRSGDNGNTWEVAEKSITGGYKFEHFIMDYRHRIPSELGYMLCECIASTRIIRIKI